MHSLGGYTLKGYSSGGTNFRLEDADTRPSEALWTLSLMLRCLGNVIVLWGLGGYRQKFPMGPYGSLQPTHASVEPHMYNTA